MLPAIGLIVGATGIVVCLYVATRLAQLWPGMTTATRVLAALTTVAAVLAVLVIGFTTAGLLVAGVSPTP